ncbi:MAG TPA: ice-binding family protein [Gaiellaceae bacterium]|nr:ice-binding family protein [Gaiellaceae bacterium]
MKLFQRSLRATMGRSKLAGASLFMLGLLAVLLVTGSAGAAASAVPLGTAGSFSVLAGAGITNTGPTTVSGDIGTFPTTTITGLESLTVHGTNHAGDAVTQQAKNDLVTAYNDAAGQGPTSPIAADLGGQTLTAGVYTSASTIGLTGALTLNAAGDPNAVFVFQAGSALTTASGSSVNLINGAQACNVFWQVGSSATLGTGSSFRGTILALTSITVTTGATVDGRVLARNGAVTLDTNTITTSSCVTAPPPATTTATTTAVTTAPTTTVVTTAPTTTAPAPKPKPPVVKKIAKPATTKKAPAVVKPAPKPAVHAFGFTG